MKTILQITPCPKPRMTRSDRLKKRDCVIKYWNFKEKIMLSGIKLLPSGWHVTFVLPMPGSWSEKKKSSFDGKPHQQKPDKDNLEKGLLDALFDDDSHIWDGRVTKIWGRVGKIVFDTTEGVAQSGQRDKLYSDRCYH